MAKVKMAERVLEVRLRCLKEEAQSIRTCALRFGANKVAEVSSATVGWVSLTVSFPKKADMTKFKGWVIKKRCEFE